MPTPVEPIAQVKLGAGIEGMPIFPRVGLVGPGPTLVIQETEQATDGLVGVIDRLPDIAGMVLLVCLVVLAMRCRRVAGRRQRRDRLYCRKCNYEILPAAPPTSARGLDAAHHFAACPECGADLGKKRPVQGRSRRRRVLPLALIVVLPMIVCTGVIVLRLQRFKIKEGETWPVPWMERILPPLAFQKRASLSRGNSLDIALMLKDGRAAGEAVRAQVYYSPTVPVTPDGRRLVAVRSKQGLGSASWFVDIFDLPGGACRTVEIVSANAPVTIAMLAGFSDDSQRVYVASQRIAVGMSVTYDMVLEAIDLETLAIKSVATVSEPPMSTLQARTTPAFHVYESKGDVRWTMLRTDAFGPSTLRAANVEITHFDGRERRIWQVPLGGIVFSSGRLVEDGKSLELPVVTMGAVGSSIVRVDLKTQQTSVRNVSALPGQIEADRRFDVVPGLNGELDVTRARDAATVTVGSRTGGSIEGSAVFSTDGRYMAASMVCPGRGPLGIHGEGTLDETVVFVWDLREEAWSVPKKGAGDGK